MSYSAELLEWIGPRSDGRERRLLHIGCGSQTMEKHPVFGDMEHWQEIRYDGDARCMPDMVGSLTSFGMVEDDSIDCVYGSHCIEHLQDADALQSIGEMARVTHHQGCALLICPNLTTVARLLAQDKGLEAIYKTPGGQPVSTFDMFHGAHFFSLAAPLMRHTTAFDVRRLANFCCDAGFSMARGISDSLNAYVIAFHTSVGEALANELIAELVAPSFGLKKLMAAQQQKATVS